MNEINHQLNNINYEYSIENDDFNRMNSQCNPQIKPHCQKCGRRMKSERKHGQHDHRLKLKRDLRMFPTELPSYEMFNQNSSRKSSPKNILIDQFIQVQRVNSTKCNTLSHTYDFDNDAYEMHDTKTKENSLKLESVQQMIYLRENINNLTYREFYFPSEYIVLKRLEESNHLINQNRYKVDHCFRTLKLQYQIMSTLLQDITIKSFNYSKQQDSDQDINHSKSSRHLLVENKSNDRSLSIINEIRNTHERLSKPIDNLTINNQLEPSLLLPMDNNYSQQQCSQNAISSYSNTDCLTKPNFLLDTSVLIDTNQTSYQDKENHVKPILNMEMPSSYYTTNPTSYYDQYSSYTNVYQPETTFLPCSYNSNPISTESIVHTPMYNESYSYETMCFPVNSYESTGIQYLAPSYQNVPSSIHQLSNSRNSLSSTHSETVSNTSTTIEKQNLQTINYTQAINKIKQILNILQTNLLHKKAIPRNENMNKDINLSTCSDKISLLNIDQISDTITSDSLKSNTSIQTTYSVMSTLPIYTNKNSYELPYSQSTINVENEISQMDFDSLNLTRTKSHIKFLNSAKNMNTNYQISEDETEIYVNYSKSKLSQSHPIHDKNMSPSFMFILQLLLILCLTHRIVIYYFFGIESNDPLNSIITENFKSSTPISCPLISKTESISTLSNKQIFDRLLSSFFKFILS